MDLSVIICTHNPRRELLGEVLERLSAQTVDPARIAWEVIVVDNNSAPPVALDVHFPVGLRVVREPNSGLIAARCRGVRESCSPVLVFIDDDNLVDPDYVETAVALASRHPEVGVFSARIRPRFEGSVPGGYSPFLRFLALTEFSEDHVAFSAPCRSMPVGAGMVVRRSVMEAYEAGLRTHPLRARMDRAPGTLLAGGDTDIGYAAFALGLGCGRFTGLTLAHHIPVERLQPGYLRSIVRDVSCSHEVLRGIHGKQDAAPSRRSTLIFRAAVLWWLRWRPTLHLRYHQTLGRLDGLRLAERLGSSSSTPAE